MFQTMKKTISIQTNIFQANQLQSYQFEVPEDIVKFIVTILKTSDLKAQGTLATISCDEGYTLNGANQLGH